MFCSPGKVCPVLCVFRHSAIEHVFWSMSKEENQKEQNLLAL